MIVPFSLAQKNVTICVSVTIWVIERFRIEKLFFDLRKLKVEKMQGIYFSKSFPYSNSHICLRAKGV